MRRDWLRSALADPRHLQIAVLGGLLVYGVAVLDLEIAAGPAALTLASALGAQLLFARWWRLPGFDPRSPLISGLSLCLLLRANEPAWLALAAFLAVASTDATSNLVARLAFLGTRVVPISEPLKSLRGAPGVKVSPISISTAMRSSPCT